MTKYLIVNADDFGYSYSVNKGIIKAHTDGIVTSTSVMVDAIAAQEAAELVKYPGLSIGLHLQLKEIKNVRAELQRQLYTFKHIVGKEPDHIDTHKNHPITDGIKEVLEDYSRRNNTPIRGFAYTKFIDTFFGMHSSGDVSVERLKEAVDQATDNFNEIMCHVGYSDDYLREHSSYNDLREQELASVCSPEVKRYISEKGLTLCNWRKIHE